MNTGLTIKQLCTETRAPFYIVRYLATLGRLPVLVKSRGPGYAAIYHRDSIDVIKKHMERRKRYH